MTDSHVSECEVPWCTMPLSAVLGTVVVGPPVPLSSPDDPTTMNPNLG